MLLGQPETVVHNLQELAHRLDDMVGGEHRDHRIRVAGRDGGGGESDGVERVAPGGFAEKLLGGKPVERGGDGLRMAQARADVAVFCGDKTLQPVEGELEQTFSADERDELFWQLGAAHRPQPRARTASNNQRVSHVFRTLSNPCWTGG